MKVLLCSANYAPELTGIGKYSGEMAAWLAAQGHEVRVVAAPPYYPAWRVAESHRGRAFLQERLAGVRVWRAPLWVPARPGGPARVLHLLSFGFASAPLLLWWALAWRPQVVVVVAPFLTSAPGAWLAARAAGARAWLHVQDWEVDVAFGMGLLKGEGLRRVVTAAERWLLRRFDRVSTISERMLQRAAAKGVAAQRLVRFPNWVDEQAIRPLQPGTSTYRAELGLPEGAVVVLFSGTLGAKQGLQIIPQAARLLADEPALHFVICGDGPMKPELLRLAEGLPAMRFLPLQPAERLGELLGLADMHVLPQDVAAEDLVLPSKLSGMLASGRPVVATCAPGSEMAAVVGGCGLVVPPGDAPALAAALRRLAGNAVERERLGRAARAWAEERLGRDAVLRRFEAELQRVVQGA